LVHGSTILSASGKWVAVKPEPVIYTTVISVFEQKIKLHQLYAGLMVVGVSLLVGYLLALGYNFGWIILGGLVALSAWVLLLPYHSTIAIWLAVSTFNAAFILPVLPGRPFVWEFAALLAWSGLVLTVSLRQYNPDFGKMLRQNRWVFVGIVGYCAVLLVTMAYRGVGLRILGGAQMGGRFYFQQIACAIFPLLFVLHPLKEKTLIRLFLLQCILSGTYLISDFAFAGAGAGGKLSALLNFFELPGDAINFELQSLNFGLRRFQSLGIICQGFLFAVLVFYRLKDFYTRKGLYLIPMALIIVGLGLYSGHRWVIVINGLTLLFCFYTQRFFDLKNTVISVVFLGLVLFTAYGYADQMPLTVQRALSVLPGIDIDNQARADGASTLETRRLLRRAGWDMIPEYFWVGRGFGLSSQVDYSSLWEPTGVTAHINAGKFYNGVIGLMINTGVFGTFFMLLFMLAGSLLAWRVIRHLRKYGCDDSFSRICSLIACLWMANMIAFIFIHGDSEFAMKTFSFQAGLLMACHRLLQERLNPRQLAA
jgi:hypothetical protein